MNDLLAPGNRATLGRFAARTALLAFDYDGTLAPIVARPSHARMRRSTRALLRRAALFYPCAVLTGRRRDSALRLLRGTGVGWIVGNHGLEWPRELPGARKQRALVEGWKALLRRRPVAGVRVEDKGLSLSVHLRRAADPRAARRAVQRLARALPGCRVEPGIEVVNLLPADAPGKGEALLRLRRESGCTHAIFLGDDVTDEAVFRLRDEKVLSARVGGRRRTAARFRLRSQAEVDELLRALVAERQPLRRGG